MALLALTGVLGAWPRSVEAATLPAGFVETTYVSGFGTRLTAMEWSPDGRLFVSQKTGALRVVKNGQLLTEPFVTLPVDSTSERGLLGVAFDPDFSTNRFVYVFYVNASTVKSRISRFTASASNPDIAQPGSEKVLLDNIPSDAGYHNGGGLHFGRDGKLYISVGDSGSGPNAQNLSSLAGKMLRINGDGSVPSGNPFVGQSGRRPEIWAYGLRNPYTFAFERRTGRLFINDVGNKAWEEINDGRRGANYGWPTCEGACNRTGFVDPLYAYSHASGTGKSITGGVFYDGGRFPAEYADDYFFADYVGNYIKRYDPATGAVVGFATGIPTPVDLRVGPDGALYYLSVEGGKVGRVSYGGSPPPTATPTRTPTPVGKPPIPTIDTPASGFRYRAGETVTFSGHATDVEDGSLPASRLTWEVMFHHDTHTHPFIEPRTGISTGSFTLPTGGEASANTWYRIHLRATDSDGNAAELTRDILPRTSTITLTTSPAGLSLSLDGTPFRAPLSFVGVEGFRRQLTAPATQTTDGNSYEFVVWSDGGARDHSYVTPTSSTTVTATYRLVGQGAAIASDHFERDVSDGWGVADRGGAWVISGRSDAFAVSDGMATIALPGSGANRGARLDSVVSRDVDVRARVWVSRRATGGPFYAYFLVRSEGLTEYRPKILFQPDGFVALHVGRVIDGRETALGSLKVTGLRYAAGERLWVRVQIVGANPTTLRIKAWASGDPEPSSWQLVVTDSSPRLQSAGHVGLRAYMSSRATGGGVTVAFDDYSVVAP